MKKVVFSPDNLLIQSMTNTKTSDIEKTLYQINELSKLGCHLVRVAVFDDADVNSLSMIVKKSPIPIIADIHFNYKYALDAIKAGVFKIRLNPGNIKNKSEIQEIIQLAKKYGTWIRIGINVGSLDEDILKECNGDIIKTCFKMLDNYLAIFEQNSFNNIVISLKSSDPLLNLELNKLASKKYHFPIHCGVTEAGPLTDATIKSCISLVPLLKEKIPSTIRISISDNPTEEIKVAYKILNNLKIMHNRVNIISCPTCGRLSYKLFDVVREIDEYCTNKYFPLTISILGCIVNGIGEGQHADIGLAGSNEKCIIFSKGKIIKTVDSSQAVSELKKLIDLEYSKYLESSNKN